MPLPLLLQAATANDALSGHLVQAAVALILALQAWVLRSVTSMREDVRTIRQTVFGVNNDNGINGTVQDHESRITECEGYIERTVPERLKLWDAFKLETKETFELHRHRFDTIERNEADRRQGPTDRRIHE